MTTQRLEILHVDPERGFGGGERQVLALLRHLAQRGHRNLLAVDPAGRLRDLVPAPDAEVVDLALRGDLDGPGIRRLRRLIAREQPDVIHLHTARALAVAPWLGASRARTIVTRRMDHPIGDAPWSRWWARMRYQRSVASIVAISEGVKRVLVAGGIDASAIEVIPSAVDAPAGLATTACRAAARRALDLDEAPAIVVVAALERRKGQDVLLEALQQLRDRNRKFQCLLAGEGSSRSFLEARVAELGLAGRVRLLGRLDQVADLLAAADLAAMPSRREGLGVAVLEAMSFALPVVASRVGGLPESVVDGETGLLVPAGDPGALAEALEALLLDAERRVRMGRAGRARVLEHFTTERMADRYEQLYARIVAQADMPQASATLPRGSG